MCKIEILIKQRGLLKQCLENPLILQNCGKYSANSSQQLHFLKPLQDIINLKSIMKKQVQKMFNIQGNSIYITEVHNIHTTRNSQFSSISESHTF